MIFAARSRTTGRVNLGDGARRGEIPAEAEPTLTAQIDAGFGRWRHPHRRDWPLVTSVADIATFNDGQLDALLGPLS